MLRLFFFLLYRDYLQTYRQPLHALLPSLFFLMVLSLFPLMVTDNKLLLQAMGPGVIWLTALLANLLTFDRLFREDFLTGQLDQWFLSPQPLWLMVTARLLAHWLITCLPLMLVTPLLAMWFYLSWLQLGVLMVTLLLGTPILTAIGATVAALTIGLHHRGVLLALLLLPLFIPILIFSVGAVASVDTLVSTSGTLALLAAITLFAVSLLPWVVTFSLRIGIDE